MLSYTISAIPVMITPKFQNAPYFLLKCMTPLNSGFYFKYRILRKTTVFYTSSFNDILSIYDIKCLLADVMK